jgi:glucan 1,3-beta-glucosidase
MAGSQNGWNHSGRLGTINILKGPMGVANAQRGLDHIRIITEFISQPQYRDVVPMFGVMNEPQGAQEIGKEPTSSLYVLASPSPAAD